MAKPGNNNQKHTLEEVLREFVNLQSRGQTPDIDEFARKYPDLEDQIKRRLRKLQKINNMFGMLVQPDESDFEDDGAEKNLAGKKIGSFETPEMIGRYKLLNVLGDGGMGVVYLAEQKQPIRRRVALKVIKPGMDTKRVIARFEAERQALALFDHLNIAKVFDAGTTETGRPYFVMEYVKGLPITEYCDRHKLTVEDRLSIFRQVCLAVHYAHQKGIIHRDIKPSNIIVSLQGDQAIPKIIDFGVAKAIAQPLTERTVATVDSQLLGTPEYMSPEQADMANEDIDTRSDIYSLGVLLYVLLTGVLPFDSETLRTGGIEQIRKLIRETDPKTPSTRLSSLGEEANTLAENRRAEAGTLTKRLHKELEWIPLKAMRKERTERYRSASELADDIENYLNGAPLLAGPPAIGYKLRKFARRNRVLVAGAIIVLLVLVAGTVISTIFAIKAERAREEVQAVSDFLQYSVLESLDPYKVGGRQITIRSVLDTASKDLQNEFHGTPMAEAEIRHTLGFAYWSLGLYKQQVMHYERAINICRVQLGNEDPKTLLLIKELGWGYISQCRYKDGEKMFSEAFNGMRKVLGVEDERTLHAMASLGTSYYLQGRFQDYERYCRKALETIRLLRGEEHTGAYCILLGNGYHLHGRYKEAEQLFTKSIEICHHKHGEKGWYTLEANLRLGELYLDMGRYEKAEHHLLKALEGWLEAWGQEYPETLWTKIYLGWVYQNQGKYKEAEELLKPTLETAQRVLGDDYLLSAHAMHGLSTLYLSQGRYDEAELLLEKALETANNLLGEKNWYALRVLNTIGKLYTAQNYYIKAEKLYLDTLDAGRRVLGNDHPTTLTSIHELAMLYKVQGDYAKAEPLFVEALEGRRLKLGDTHPHTLESWNNLIDLYKAWNKPEIADQWLTKRPQTEAAER